jgi:hypothetical protein
MAMLGASGQIQDTQIEIHTRLRRSIRNTQSWSMSNWDWQSLADVAKKFPNAQQVADACPVYNCHGLTFGSRRSMVEYADIPKVIQDDGFTQVSERDARPGDVVLYVERGGDISHSGFVIGKRPLLTGSTAERPLIWSKWGKGPEMIHSVDQCDFFLADEYVRYYRLTNWKNCWIEHGRHD